MFRTGRSHTLLFAIALSMPSLGVAQTADQADPSHHKLEFENECVRVIRASYGPGERSDGMFDTAGIGVVVVSLTGSTSFKLHTPDGQSKDLPPRTPGEAYWVPGRGKIALENTSDKEVKWLVIWPKAGCATK
jgi:hypothetical protein